MPTYGGPVQNSSMKPNHGTSRLQKIAKLTGLNEWSKPS
jgi:hypothetical protein